MSDPLALIVVALAVAHAVLLIVIAPLRGWKSHGTIGRQRLRTAVIVPCCGDLDGDLTENLRAIAQQERRPDRLILVARSETDAAIPIMRRLQRALSFVEVVVSGRAQYCGQKNHNLLAAVERAGDADVYLFADSDIRPDDRWLDSLLEPLESDPDIGAATALCDLPPAGDSLAIATQALFSLHQSGFQRLLAVTWGGSTAVRACLFRAAGVSAEWARAVLDDWVLWRRVVPLARIVTVPVINSGAKSRARTWSECLDWNVRQFQYFRLYGALAFHTLLIAQLLTAVVLVCLPARALLLGLSGIEVLIPSIAYLILMTLLNLLLFRCARGRQIGFWQRLGASLLAPALIAFVTIAAWLRRAMVWRGITYHLDRHGRVRSMEVTAPALQGDVSTSVVHLPPIDAKAANVADQVIAAFTPAPLD